MSKKYPGGYLTKTPPTVSQTSAPGIWTLEQAEYYQQAGTWPVAPDPNFNQVSLLLHGDGTNGAQNNTFVDSSTNNFTITRTGNVAQGTFSPFSLADGQWSNYFDGSGDFLGVPTGIANFGTSDFTIEFWVNYSTPSGDIIDTRGGSFANGAIAIRLDGTSLYTVVGATTTITTPAPTSNTWHHISVCRASGSTKLFVDGVQKGSTYADSNNYGDFYSRIGSYAGGAGNYLAGYISNMRIVKGTALYTDNFTPPTAPLTAITNTSLLTCQSNRFIDNSSNNFTITRNGDTKVTAFSPFAPSAAYSASTNGGSGYFDGNGDYLSTPATTAFNFGTGDFTVEAWVYYNGTNNSAIVSSAGSSFAYGISGKLRFYTSDGLNIFDATSNFISKQWVHVAAVRSGGTLTLYQNGTAVGSTSYTHNISGGTAAYYVSTYYASPGNFGWNGYISSLRVVSGTAIYTSNFTPPTAPLTAVTNTQLLLNCTNAAIYDNAGKNDIETVGDAQISTSVKKYGTGSMYFDGTGDWLAIPSSTEFDVGGGDFTIECWVYASSTQPAYAGLVSRQGSGGVQIIMGSGGTTVEAWGNPTAGATRLAASTTTVTNSNWHHIALVRNGSLFKIYVDGVAGSITLTSSSAFVAGAQPLYIGLDTGQGGRVFNGYIDDIRITKGVARYTANFTPPNGPFPNV